MNSFIPALIMGFREGLEALLMIVVIFQFLNKVNLGNLKKYGTYGLVTGLVGSTILGGILYLVTYKIGRTEQSSQLWESVASIIALILVTTFIFWMMNNGKGMVSEIQSQVKANLTKSGVFILSFILVAREGAEISIFTFAGEYSIVPVLIGFVSAAVIAIAIYYSLFKVNLKVIFTITLAYLILQSGYLLGYGIHELSEALEGFAVVSEQSWLMQKAFDLSDTMLSHKDGLIGLPLNVLLGWYSKPEWTQLIAHYSYVIALFIIWRRKLNQ